MCPADSLSRISFVSHAFFCLASEKFYFVGCFFSLSVYLCAQVEQLVQPVYVADGLLVASAHVVDGVALAYVFGFQVLVFVQVDECSHIVVCPYGVVCAFGHRAGVFISECVGALRCLGKAAIGGGDSHGIMLYGPFSGVG